MEGTIEGTPGSAAPAAAAGLMPLPDLAPSTSRAMTRPCGPEPWILDSSMPASFASRLASGEANTRPPDDGAAAGWGFAAAGGAAGADFGASVLGVSAFAGCGLGGGAALPAPEAAALTSSPSPASTAITWVTGTSADDLRTTRV